MELHASLLSAPILKLGEWIEEKQKQGIRIFHVDFIDPTFADYIGIDFKIIDEFSKKGIEFWVHYMASWNEILLQKIAEKKPKGIFLHQRCIKDYDKLQILKQHTKIGIALEIGEKIEYDCDEYLLMSVKAGYAGQEFNIDGIKQAEELRAKGKKLTADGGITPKTIKYVKDFDYVVIGSALEKYTLKEFYDEILNKD